MAKQIYVNLPVKDLNKSVEFFTELGYTFNAEYTDETATCMVVSNTIYVMLLTEKKFKEFIPNTISDAKQSTEVLICLSCDTKEEVDDLVRKAVAAGGSTFKAPQEHGGFMYAHSYQDLDGHIWELIHMYV